VPLRPSPLTLALRAAPRSPPPSPGPVPARGAARLVEPGAAAFPDPTAHPVRDRGAGGPGEGGEPEPDAAGTVAGAPQRGRPAARWPHRPGRGGAGSGPDAVLPGGEGAVVGGVVSPSARGSGLPSLPGPPRAGSPTPPGRGREKTTAQSRTQAGLTEGPASSRTGAAPGREPPAAGEVILVTEEAGAPLWPVRWAERRPWGGPGEAAAGGGRGSGGVPAGARVEWI